MYKSRRSDAAAAASASSMVPINSKSTRPAASSNKRPAVTEDGNTGPTPPPNARITKPPQLPGPPPPRDAEGRLSVLQPEGTIDADEVFGEQEKALNEFLRLHPMLSACTRASNTCARASVPSVRVRVQLESTSHRTMQLMANLVEEASIPTRELEVCSKAHDDCYLRPANPALGERGCCLGERCICVWLARWRYGDDTDYAFIGTEFLLPSEKRAFEADGTLPTMPGKCLVCSRYFHTYVYRAARSDPTFKPSANIPLQAYGNQLGFATGASMPTHANVVSDADGYRQEAMLFVDEEWAETAAARGSMSTFLWRPVVKFCATNYKYVRDPSGVPRMIQVGVGVRDDTDAGRASLSRLHFREPAPPSAATELASATARKTSIRP